jgi:aminopeptidase YwaD
MKFIFFFVFVFIIFNIQLKAQDLEYAKKEINILSSSKFHGRGYTHKGDLKASKHIASELNKHNIQKLNSSYFQNFTMPVCIISNLGTLKIDSAILSPGFDFIIHPGSASCSGKYELLWLTQANIKEIFTTNVKEKFLVIDTNLSNDKSQKEIIDGLRFSNPVNAKGIIYLIKKSPMQIQRNEELSWVSMESVAIHFPHNAKQIEISFKEKSIEKYKTRNVVGYIPGETDTFVVFTAHYDHIGELGTTYYPGANDNAAGVAMVLDLAKTYSKQKPHYSIGFLLFTGEEIGLVGSSYFVNHPLIPLEKIRILLNLDVIGSGEDGITVVNGSVFQKEFDLLKNLNTEKNYVPIVKIRGASNNSDHAPFYVKNVKSFFVYAQGKTGPYHHPFDQPENLSLGKYENIVKLLIDFVGKLN